MRTFPTHRTWGSDNNNRDRMSLLATSSSSPPSSARMAFQTTQLESADHKRKPTRGGTTASVSSRNSSNSFDSKQQHLHLQHQRQQRVSTTTPEKNSGAIQFVPAYEESTMSPDASGLDTTEPLSSPEQSFSMDHETSGAAPASAGYRRGSPSNGAGAGAGAGTSSPYSKYYQRSPVAAVTPSPTTSTSLPQNTAAQSSKHHQQSYRFHNSTNSSTSDRTPIEPVAKKRAEESSSTVSTATSSSQQRKGGAGATRMGRLASLFSSRAIVKGAGDDPPPPCPSPPRSDSSSGYVGWPGTQDKRGGTVPVVAMEQSSYSDSEVGATTTRTSSVHKSDSLSISSSTGDYNLAAAIVNATAAANSPLMNRRVQQRPMTTNEEEALAYPGGASPMDEQVRGVGDIYGQDQKYTYQTVGQLTDPWGGIGNGSNSGVGSTAAANDESMSEVSTKYSKTSSAYFNPKELRALQPLEPTNPLHHRQAAAAAVMRFQPGKPQPPTEEALRLNDQLAPPHRTFNATNALGYRGLLEKTRDVPNLMDGTESESTHSSISGTNYSSASHQQHMRRGGRMNRRIPPDPEDQRMNRRIPPDPDQLLEEVSSDIFDGVAPGGGKTDSDSDVFDGLSNAGGPRNEYLNRTPSIPENGQYTLGAMARNDNEGLNVVLLGGGLTTIQTTSTDFTNRQTASDFDENLSNSDYDQYGFARIPGFNEMATAGNRLHDRSLADNLGGISAKLFAQSHSTPSQRAQAAIKKYSSRTDPAGSEASASSAAYSDQYDVDSWTESARGSLQRYYVHPDEMKGLVKKFRKMSSKVSATLNTLDEMEREEDATKAFALMEMRSRIMEKDIERGLERRGGTSVVDDLVLTPYNRAAMRVRDALVVAKAWRDGATPKDVVYTSLLTRRSERAYYILRPSEQQGWNDSRSSQRYTWEEVGWVDDLELSQYRCHSIGPRHLRGFEMFTIGDCQSILLKLCNQECLDLRRQLNYATAEQIEAEEEMKVEETDFGIEGMMTEAEMRYLTSMEEVKTVSHKLVLAEKAFNLVRDRIEKLVAKYEALLVQFDNDAESVAPSSVVTDASSYYSDYTSVTFHEEKEREALARRAQRAELRAELAAREAMLTKQRARELRNEKEMEIQVLRQKLSDLQSESSAAIAEREHSVVLARAIAASRRAPAASSSQLSTPKSTISSSKIEDVKQRFRNRSADRNSRNPPRPTPASSRGFKSSGTLRRKYQDQNSRDRSAMFRAVGEEMFQQLDFYERSLKAVEPSH